MPSEHCAAGRMQRPLVRAGGRCCDGMRGHCSSTAATRARVLRLAAGSTGVPVFHMDACAHRTWLRWLTIPRGDDANAQDPALPHTERAGDGILGWPHWAFPPPGTLCPALQCLWAARCTNWTACRTGPSRCAPQMRYGTAPHPVGLLCLVTANVAARTAEQDPCTLLCSYSFRLN